MKQVCLCLVAWLCGQAALQAQFYIDPGAKVSFAGSALVTIRDINFENDGALTTGTSTLFCTGKSNQVIISGGATLYNLHFEKPSGREIALGDDMRVTHEIAWVIPGTRLVLGKFNLYMEPNAFLTNYGDDAYVVTNNTGHMAKEDLDGNGFFFPLSAGDGAYNPVHVVESGAPDRIGVRCLAEALNGGYDGSAIGDNAVAAAWDVTESMPGGSKLTLMVQWGAGDELPDFDRNNCGLAQYDPTSGWIPDAANLAPAGGNDPFTRNHGPLAPGLYMVADEGFASFSSHPAMAMRNSNPVGPNTSPTAVLLYPNPSSGALFLEIGQLPASTENITVRVFDSKGVRILNQQLAANSAHVFRLDTSISDLQAGFYVIRVESPQGLLFRSSFIRL